MADKAQGAVSFTPIVTIASGSDADADAIDVIQHNIKGTLGGECKFEVQDGDDNWFYAPNVIFTNLSQELFGDGSDDNTLTIDNDTAVDNLKFFVSVDIT